MPPRSRGNLIASGLAVPQAAFDVGAGGGIPAQAGESDAVQGGVGLPIAAAVESAPQGLAGGRFDRADSAEGGEGGFGVEPVGVVTRGDEQGGAGVGSYAVAGQQVRGVSGQDGGQPLVQVVDLLGQQGDPLGQQAQRVPGGLAGVGGGVGDLECDAGAHE